MIEKETAGSAEGRSKAKSTAASRAKATAAKPARRTAGKPPSPGRCQDDMYERIQRRAYELWESEGRPAGRDEVHWLQAESEIARARTRRVGISG